MTVESMENPRHIVKVAAITLLLAGSLWLFPQPAARESVSASVTTPSSLILGQVSTTPGQDSAQQSPSITALTEGATALGIPTTLPCAKDMKNGAESYTSFRTCWEEAFNLYTAQYDVTKVLSSIHEWQTAVPELTSICHELSHRVGRASYDRFKSAEEALAQDDRKCQYGYRHGVFEAFAGAEGPAGVDRLASTICKVYEDMPGLNEQERGLEVGECLHSVGHAAAVAHPTDVKAAVDTCGVFEAASSKQGCAGGVLMEFVNSYMLANLGTGVGDTQHGPSLSKIDDATVENLCTILDSAYAEECFRRVPPMWGVKAKKDTKLLVARCQKQSGAFIKECMFGIGEWLFRATTTAETEEGRSSEIVKLCGAAPSGDQRGACVSGAARPFRSNDLWAGESKEEWTELCDLLDVPSRPECEKAETAAEEAFGNIPVPNSKPA